MLPPHGWEKHDWKPGRGAHCLPPADVCLLQGCLGIPGGEAEACAHLRAGFSLLLQLSCHETLSVHRTPGALGFYALEQRQPGALHEAGGWRPRQA